MRLLHVVVNVPLKGEMLQSPSEQNDALGMSANSVFFIASVARGTGQCPRKVVSVCKW